MAWAEQDEYIPAADSATWISRASGDIRRPALFAYLDTPSGIVRASTHHKSVTTTDASTSPSTVLTWSGVGNIAKVEMLSPYTRNSAQIAIRLGLASLPQGSIDPDTEAGMIGRRAKLYEGLFDENWENPVLRRVFIGRIANAGDFKHRRDDKGNWVIDASIEINNGRNPRNQIELYHSIRTAAAGDTAWRHLPTAGRALTWPALG